MSQRVEQCKLQNRVLRHVSTINVGSGEVCVRLTEVPYNHVFSVTPAACECVRFYTQNHCENPLVVLGQAEGLENTANALLAECLNLMRGVGGMKAAGLNSQRLSRTSSSVAFGSGDDRRNSV